jgi:nucleoid DNA-binding protein
MASIVDEIVKVVAKKTNMPEPVAKIAVDTVLSTLKKKLPSNVEGILDSFLDSGSTSSKAKSSK